MNMSEAIDSLNHVIEELKSDLDKGLLGSGIWNAKDGQQIAHYQARAKAAALFNEVTRMLKKTLSGSEFPGLGSYYLVHLDNGNVVIVVRCGDYQLGALVDLSETTMGILMSVALPNLQQNLKEATSKLPQ